MLENYLEPATCVLIATSLFSSVGWIKAVFRNKELVQICNSLKRANDNLSKTFPDLKTLVAVSKDQQKQKETDNDQSVRTYKAVRVNGAPDISLGDITEVIITANSKEKAIELLNSIAYFEDDGWWTVETVYDEKVISIKHLGGLLDD